MTTSEDKMGFTLVKPEATNTQTVVPEGTKTITHVVKSFNEMDFTRQVKAKEAEGFTIKYMNTAVRQCKNRKVYSYYAELEK